MKMKGAKTNPAVNENKTQNSEHTKASKNFVNNFSSFVLSFHKITPKYPNTQ
jgi:hypothetical protein